MNEIIYALIGLAIGSFPLCVAFMLLTDKSLFICWIASALFTVWKLILDYVNRKE